MPSFFRKMTVILLVSVFMVDGKADARQPIPEDKTCNSIADLKQAYLKCERSAQSGHLSTGAIAYCSKIYYDLKDKAFDGDFAKIRSWYELSASVERLGSAVVVGPWNTQTCG